MQCEVCRKAMKEYRTLHINYVDGVDETVVNESEPIYYIYKGDRQYKCCGECWREQ